MRVILFTGKGGVGKTSLAAATAVRAADMGKRTIVLSTDIAHSLADSLDVELANEPREVIPNLWGQETEIYKTLETYWGVIQRYIAALMSWRGMSGIVADEVAILPGMEELANLLYIERYRREGTYDVVIVDSAPTGETLRLLSFPDMLHWWMNRLFPLQRKVAAVVRPVVGAISDIPLPSNSVMDAVVELYAELEDVHKLLLDGEQTSIRLVVNPEKMVIKEAQRTLTYLNLFGYSTDSVIVNRILPQSLSDAYFTGWKESQRKYIEYIDEAFSPLPILNMPLLDQEVVGLAMLRRMAAAVYGDSDPTKFYYKGHVQTIDKVEDGYVLNLELPFASKEQVSLIHSRDELNVKVGSYRRTVTLPHVLINLKVSEAKMDDHILRIHFLSESPAVEGAAPKKQKHQ
ncbi:ArsA family ATPase [Dehalogenimonas etheniformans]|uniref:arsenite-transporting ATPase n=1 Tax=Dehalogenimonas etheniformans TaxID=1536648 RepID=A0A2P5P6Y9_9CHLR|nr:TRC40/GET3/ArsA family transport-energizing ATPase [Dehalogenimonas etheniformans]PPD58063.1 arsenic-transporting ATPase [Dehalogenimonas etheniformans]QNT75286.1 ArsA family ATPase [Dehalogenimonas etheniformans]